MCVQTPNEGQVHPANQIDGQNAANESGFDETSIENQPFSWSKSDRRLTIVENTSQTLQGDRSTDTPA